MELKKAILRFETKKPINTPALMPIKGITLSEISIIGVEAQ